MKNVNFKVDSMGNIHITADKDEMLVAVSWELSWNKEDWYGKHTVTSTFGFNATGDMWDIINRLDKLEDAKAQAKARALLEMSRLLIDLAKPAAPVKEEVTEERDSI